MIRRVYVIAAVIFLILLWSAVFAATDGVQINLSVSQPSPGGGPLPPKDIKGCTDPAATNYNPQATTNDGSCVYAPPPVPNVSNFSAFYLKNEARAVLTWLNPSFAEFAAVRLVRQSSGVPAGPTDGLLIYDGGGQTAFDATVAPGQIYFYAAFVRDTANNYSSGAVVSLTVPAPPPPPPDDDKGEEKTDEKPTGETPGDGESPGVTGGAVDPFAVFPEVVDPDPLIQKLALGDFVFFQPGERQRFFRGGEAVPVKSGKELSVLVNYNRLPEALKIIGLTIIDPKNPGRPRSFILRFNQDGTAYTAALGVLFKNGVYPFYLSIINFKNQTIKRLSGQLVVSGSAVPAAAVRAVSRVGAPIVTVVGLGSGVVQALAVANQINSFSDLYFLIVHFWSLLLRVLGLKRRFRPWGVVYDSVTKRPLDPAYVLVERNKEEAATAITDLDGRYGFFLPSATYTLVANKTHYRFPSLKLQGKNRDELYDNLYFGEPFVSAEGEVINRNIPLDPVAFDWNEFAKDQQGFFILHSRRERRRRLIYNTLFGLGLLLALYQLLFQPGWLNVILPALYLGVFLLKYFWRARHRAVVVRRAATGLPVPFAIIRAFVPGVDQSVKSVVADALGRFFLLTPPGEYYLTVEEKLPDESYQKIYQSEPLKLDKGVLIKDLII